MGPHPCSEAEVYGSTPMFRSGGLWVHTNFQKRGFMGPGPCSEATDYGSRPLYRRGVFDGLKPPLHEISLILLTVLVPSSKLTQFETRRVTSCPVRGFSWSSSVSPAENRSFQNLITVIFTSASTFKTEEMFSNNCHLSLFVDESVTIFM
jgi:hypothetical protein